MEKLLISFVSLLLILTPAYARLQEQPSSQQNMPQNSRATQVQKEKTAERSNPANRQGETRKDANDAVRISVTLVQVDAIVTDDQGRHVTDLKPEDFQILENGRPQHIVNFSYIKTQPDAVSRPEAPSASSDKTALAVPPVRLQPGEVRRTMALVVDDLSMSFESIGRVRQALKKFVDEQMQPGDLVAIFRTNGGMGILQQFTNDKRLLHAAIDRVRLNLMGQVRIGATDSIPVLRNIGGLVSDGSSGARIAPGAGRLDSPSRFDTFREELFSVAMLGTVSFIVDGLKLLPGRKAVVLLSDGFKLFSQGDAVANGRVLESVRRLADHSNRSSVAIYTIDPRGLQPLQLAASDNLVGLSPQQLLARLDGRSNSFKDSKEGLYYLAAQTGGFFIHNANDIGRALGRVLDDQKGYYLIGYVPDEKTFATRKGKDTFHKITVKVKPAGLHVRSRMGFYAIPDEEVRRQPETPADKLALAMASPFSSDSISLRLTSLFWHEPEGGSYIRSLLYIDGRSISFSEQPDGTYKAVVDLAAFLFGDNGLVVDKQARNYTLTVNKDDYGRLIRDGFIYPINVPIKKPGAYQLRVAVRDAATERKGSAHQFIEVPDMGKKRLALSGIAIVGKNPSKAEAPGGNERGPAAIDPQANPAVRRLKRDMFLDYSFLVYNARIDKTTNRPRLEVQALLLCDGKKVFAGTPSPFEPGQQSDWRHITVGGRIMLGADLQPGEYDLQIIITDRLAKEHGVASQSIDFEILN